MSYHRAPSFVFAGVPRGNPSLFYGSWKIRPGDRDTYLHLYRLPTGPSATYGYGTCVLDVFAYRGTPRHLHLARINSVRFEYHSFDTVSVWQFWLDPLRKTSPIIGLSCTFDTGIYGIQSSTGLIVFPHGLQTRASMQQFDEYWNLNGSSEISYSDTTTDEHGYVFVKSSHQEAEEGAVPIETILYWNGTSFAPRGTAPAPTETPATTQPSASASPETPH